MKRNRFLILLVMIISSSCTFSQQTVGLFKNSSEAYNGYTLFAPMGYPTSYLINNCGEKVHSWRSSYTPAASVYLLENGRLLRTGNIANPNFMAGGTGGIIEMFDWDGSIIWEFTLSTSKVNLHHDIAYMPNGNILAIAWDAKTPDEAQKVGRVKLDSVVWFEKIVEIKPDLTNGGGDIIWEWNLFDHLVQNLDSTLNNYGDIELSPQLVDVNFESHAKSTVDLFHFNSIDYNENLDQIVVSVHNYSEIWIIDHSTTQSEAASHSGGNQNKGGDLLYRWGNPQAYKKGAPQKLFLQHDAHWIPKGVPDEGKIMIFNNQAGTTSPYSTVNIITSQVDEFGAYEFIDSVFGPEDFDWTFKAKIPETFFARNISGAQRLANGNTLICEGPTGTLFEINESKNIVWKYINPVDNSGPTTQGDTLKRNAVFRSYRYPPNFPGLIGKDLIPQGYIESGSTFDCNNYTAVREINNEISLSLYPNPAQNSIQISSASQIVELSIFNPQGIKVKTLFPKQFEMNINTENFTNGIYFIHFLSQNGQSTVQKIIINK